jgi:hypothetical protein
VPVWYEDFGAAGAAAGPRPAPVEAGLSGPYFVGRLRVAGTRRLPLTVEAYDGAGRRVFSRG